MEFSKNTNPTSVYFDCRHFDGSGIGTYIGNLIRNFDQIPMDYKLELMAREEHIPIIRSYSKFNVRIYNDPIYSIAEQFTWLTKIDPFALLHVPHYNAPLFYPGKLIVTVHDVCHVAMKQFFPGMLKRIYSGQFLQKVLNKADYIITVSNFSKSEIIKYFKIPPQKINVIYNGVDPVFHQVSKEDARVIIKKHNLPEEYFLFLGNVKPHKNITGLITSYLMALNKNKDLPPLVILGQYKNLVTGIPDLSGMLTESDFKQKIIFTGFLPTEDLPSIYSQAILFLFPSFYEGFGLPTLEAMACGTPVITSNCSAIPEVVGDSAMIIDPYNTEMISESILKLAGSSDLQKYYKEKGLERVKQFSWQKSALEHLEIYSIAKRLPAKVIHKSSTPVTTQKRKLNILFLDQYGDRIGGGQVILLDILEKFRETGLWNIFISVPDEGKFTNKLREKNFSFWCVPTGEHSLKSNIITNTNRYVLSSVKSTYLLSKKIKQHNIDVIYCNGGRTFLSGSFLSLLFPLRIFWHLHLILDNRQKNVVTLFGRLPKVKSIIAVSNTLELQYNGDIINNKIEIVANWVSPELFNEKRCLRPKELVLPLRVGVVGLICKSKGQWTILKSFQLFNNILPIELLIFGEPLLSEKHHWDKFKRKIIKLQNTGWSIKHVGFQSDTRKIYDNLDILIIPSIVPEAFGLTAIEAMSREVIVISNRTGALVEIIKNKVNGFLYNATNFEELPLLLEDIIKNKFEITAIRQTGIESIQSLYHPEKQLEKLHSIVHQNITGTFMN